MTENGQQSQQNQQSQSNQPSMEDVIKERHALEDRITAFIKQLQDYRDNALILELRDLEIAIARAYDQMREAKNDSIRLDRMLKGHLLKSVYDLKRAGAKLGLMRRMKGLGGDFRLIWSQSLGWVTPKDIVEPFMLYPFQYPIPITDEHVQAWSGNDDNKWRTLLTDGRH